VFLRAEPGRRMYLGLLAVDPSHQMHGLGSLMMNAAEQWCRDAGCIAIDILVVNLREELPPFYEARGFARCGTAPFEDPRKLRPAHFIRMTRALGGPERE